MSESEPAEDGEEPSLSSPPPKRSELRTRVAVSRKISKKIESAFKKKFAARSAESEEEYAHLKGVQDHYKHKGWWSIFLMFITFVLVAFQSALLCMVGFGRWDFTDYEYLLPALLVQNFGAVVGLATFAVRSLFTPLQRKARIENSD